MSASNRHLHPDAIITSNTSGILIKSLAEGRSGKFRQRFLGTHFFNPPRYLHLMEIITTPDTSPEVACFMAGFSIACWQRRRVREGHAGFWWQIGWRIF
ncbi:MAG: 3-hydroxyacyl-CoA dehydrogenase NAD-binding domain-containing protein [Blastocatellia bacterium]